MPRRGGLDEIRYRLAGELDGNKATGFIRIELLNDGPNNDCDSGKQNFKVKSPAPKLPPSDLDEALDGAAARERAAEGDLVRVFEIGADRAGRWPGA